MPTPKGFSRTQIGLHWIVVLFIIFQFVFHEGIEDAWDVIEKGGAITFSPGVIAHVAVGNAILLFALWRLFLRFRRGVPAAPEGESNVQKLVAKIVHLLLYVLMVLLPVSGAVAMFGGVLGAGEGHEVMTGALMAVVALHFVGALFNQYVLKNGLIKRMMKAG